MRILRMQGKLLLLAMLAALAMPSLAQADPGRNKRSKARVQVYAEFGTRHRDHDRRYDRDYDRDYGYRRDLPGRRAGWRGGDLPPGLAKKRCNERFVYSNYPRYPRRSAGHGSVTIHIPF